MTRVSVERVLGVIGLALLVLPVCHIVYWLTPLALPTSLSVALVVVAAGAALLWPFFGRRCASPSTWAAAAVFFALAAAFAIHALWNSSVDGFPAMAGSDGGNHVALQRRYADGHAEVYLGRGVLSVTTFWLEQALGLDALQSYRAVFYAVVLAVLAFVAMATAIAARGWPAFLILPVVAWLPMTRVVLPMLSYYQCDGYWSQLLGLLPIFTAVGLYGVGRHGVLRLAGFALGLVVYRFTYLLNIADLILTAALLAVFELRGRRRVAWAVGAAGVVVAALAYLRVHRVTAFDGGILRVEPALLAVGVLALAGLLLAGPDLARRVGAAIPEVASRLFRAVGLFAGAGALGVLTHLVVDGSSGYYVQKYLFAAVIVAVSASLALVATLLAHATRRRDLLALAVCLAGFGTSFLLDGAASLVPAYLERTGPPPFRQLKRLADPETWREIEKVLGEKYAFAGFVARNRPETQLTNAAFGYPILSHGPYEEGYLPEVVNGPRCFFWDAGFSRREDARVKRIRETMRALPKERDCASHASRNAPGRKVVICHTCLD